MVDTKEGAEPLPPSPSHPHPPASLFLQTKFLFHPEGERNLYFMTMLPIPTLLVPTLFLPGTIMGTGGGVKPGEGMLSLRTDLKGIFSWPRQTWKQASFKFYSQISLVQGLGERLTRGLTTAMTTMIIKANTYEAWTMWHALFCLFFPHIMLRITHLPLY